MSGPVYAIDILRQVAPGAKRNYVDAFAGDNGLLDRFGITTPLRVSHFLAQMLHETGGGTVLFESLRYTTRAQLLRIFGVGHHSAAIRPEEVSGLLNNERALAERVYGLGNPRKAKALGNTKPGDGFSYRGGGVLQTTGGGNYRKMGDACQVDFYGDPELIVDFSHALKPALQEWDQGKLNAAADRNDIRTITRIINGGYNGLPERQKWFNKVWAIAKGGGTANDAVQTAQPDSKVKWLQQSLNDFGADPKLVVDGRYGPATTKATKWFQQLANIKVDGIAGDVTLAALKLKLSVKRG